jgi:hypothetical protein
MPQPKVLIPGESYTFSQYFTLPFTPEEVLSDLGYSINRADLSLPMSEEDLPFLERLDFTLRRNLRLVTLLSESARRETIVAPVLLEVCDHLNAHLNIEFTIRVNEWLKGTLDYYIAIPNSMLVIEAKQSDLTKGFTQLAVELIALDQRKRMLDEDNLKEFLYGAVTTGEMWKFGVLDRSGRKVTEDSNLYQVPRDLDPIARVLVGILTC